MSPQYDIFKAVLSRRVQKQSVYLVGEIWNLCRIPPDIVDLRNIRNYKYAVSEVFVKVKRCFAFAIWLQQIVPILLVVIKDSEPSKMARNPMNAKGPDPSFRAQLGKR